MADRVPCDHPSIDTHRADLVSVGAVDRPKLVLPFDAPAGEVVRLVLGGSVRFARLERDASGEPAVRGAYDSPRLARTPGEGVDRLAEWVEAGDVRLGGSVLVDVVAEGDTYGVRAPGEHAVYDDRSTPDSSLARIADRLED